jgi:hypothetical protein
MLWGSARLTTRDKLKVLCKKTVGSANPTAYTELRHCEQYEKTAKENIGLPIELIGDTGVLKNRTDVTMTTTRFTQLPTECVTGDTLARIMYDTFDKSKFRTCKNFFNKHVRTEDDTPFLHELFIGMLITTQIITYQKQSRSRTCWYAWKQNAAIKDLVYTCCKFRPCTGKNIVRFQTRQSIVVRAVWILTADCRNVGVTLTPSVSKVTGAKRKNDMTVIIEKRLMLSRDAWSELGKR